MLKSLVLLTGPGERTILAARLAAFRPDLRIIAAGSSADLAAIEQATLAEARIIAFVTSIIVPAPVLAGLGYGAYNFHPGPPGYPGLSPAQFALYDGARRFGATVHRMVEAVDAGPIVAVSDFAMPEPPTLDALETLAFQHLAKLFWDLSPALVEEAPLAELGIAWGSRKSTRRNTEAMCAIDPDIDPAELHRRVAAFGRSPFGLTPTLTLHGYRFRLEPAAAEPTSAARRENTAVPSAA
ncbi:MAG TPA: formyltransferase family protein [Devosia sp.]|jgi:methionyl-tRNA formyltransferase|nr:formyltransferase family protein [Devosia sp.]